VYKYVDHISLGSSPHHAKEESSLHPLFCVLRTLVVTTFVKRPFHWRLILVYYTLFYPFVP
jgi:hypothetical protein